MYLFYEPETARVRLRGAVEMVSKFRLNFVQCIKSHDISTRRLVLSLITLAIYLQLRASKVIIEEGDRFKS